VALAQVEGHLLEQLEVDLLPGEVDAGHAELAAQVGHRELLGQRALPDEDAGQRSPNVFCADSASRSCPSLIRSASRRIAPRPFLDTPAGLFDRDQDLQAPALPASR
jgi:hypothetical protein